MINIGNFFFKYRNNLFIFLYLLLFVPSPMLFSPEQFGEKYYLIPIILGLFVTFSGEIIRGITIGWHISSVEAVIRRFMPKNL